MNFQQVRQQLKLHNLEVFTTQEFINIFGISRGVAAVKLTRYKQAGYLISPRRSVYYLANEVEDTYKIANKVYSPSYISLDSILAKYDLIPETVYTITSVTTKATREFTDNQTVYRYYRIKKEAFIGYHKEGDTLLADPEKAVVDYLYFVSQGERMLNDRLNVEKINKKKVLFYAGFFSNKRLYTLIERIFT
jgi:predicted transcriptional regulator of viral defense system